MPLTNTKISNCKPQNKPYKLSDGGGMYLLVNPGGSKYWRLKYRLHGKEKTLALGVFPEVSLAQAREARIEAKKIIKKGIDPVQQKRLLKLNKRKSAENTFKAIANEWLENQKDRWTPDHLISVRKSVNKDLLPELGNMPIADITPQEVIAVVKKVENRGALEIASKVLQRARSIFRYALQTGLIKYSPASELRGTIRTRKVRHQPALKESDLHEFFNKLGHYDGDPITVFALKLLILTFVRPGELRGARWEEFNIEKGEWRIPEERMKMNEEHIVPLSRQSLQVISELQPLTGYRELLFPNRNGEGKGISENTMTYALYRMGYHSRATAHGFRSTASTILNESGFNPDVIERQLAHKERNQVRAAYNRSSYLMERKKMMQWWADYLDGIKSGAKVVPIHAGKGK